MQRYLHLAEKKVAVYVTFQNVFNLQPGYKKITFHWLFKGLGFVVRVAVCLLTILFCALHAHGWRSRTGKDS